MKNLSATLLSLTALVIIVTSCSCKKQVDPPTPPPATTYTVSYDANGGTGSVGSQSATSGSTITLQSGASLTLNGSTFNGWNTVANGSGTSYAAGASLKVTANVTLYAQWTSIYTAVFTAVDASSSASLKSLPGNSTVKALVLNVTTPGFVKLETIGSLTNGNPAIGYWWITSKDSSELFQSTSTLNPLFVRIAAQSSQNINLSVGVNVICFKTAPFSGAITNGIKIGLKVTGANGNVVSNASYTSDATSVNTTNVVKVFLKLNNGVKASANLQTTGFGGGDLQIIPFSDEAGTVYDGNLYPFIKSLAFDIKDTRWIGNTTGYSGLDFTNSSGPAGQSLVVGQLDNGGNSSPVFKNSDAILSSGILHFSTSSAVKLFKSIGGNFSSCSVGGNVFNPTSTQFGPTSICWYLKNISFVGNPELWIYAPDGTRIW